MTRLIELSHPTPDQPALSRTELDAAAALPAMVLQSIGPVRHEVRVPFHDSQVRGHAILIQTGWDRHWGSDAYWQPGPFLSPDVVFRLIRAGARLVGVDFWEIGEVDRGKLQAVVNLCNLAALPRTGFRFYALGERAVAEIVA